MRYPIASVLSALLLACEGTTGPAEIRVELERDFRLLQGGTAVIEDAGLAIDFRAVPEDSRCPPMAFCFWAGNAAVELTVREVDTAGRLSGFGDASDATDVTLNTNVAIGPASVAVGVYIISMISLEPGYRVTERPDYVVTLRVVRLSL